MLSCEIVVMSEELFVVLVVFCLLVWVVVVVEVSDR